MKEKGVYIAEMGFSNNSEPENNDMTSNSERYIRERCRKKLTSAMYRMTFSMRFLVRSERNME